MVVPTRDAECPNSKSNSSFLLALQRSQQLASATAVVTALGLLSLMVEGKEGPRAASFSVGQAPTSATNPKKKN